MTKRIQVELDADASTTALPGNKEGVELITDLEPNDRAAFEARRLVREHLIDRVPAWVLADLLTIVSELVTNAADHGESAPICLSIEWTPEKIIGKVSNRGNGLPADHTAVSPGPGLGLLIVDTIADEWQSSTEAGFTSVRFKLPSA